MPITVLDIMKLETFREFRLIAGERGLENPIERSGILDYEYEEHFEKGQFVKDSFIISSLLFAKDHPEIILDAVKGLLSDQVSGLAIKTIYFSELPETVINFANEHNFPVFLFDKSSAFFEDIITEISDKIRSVDRFELIESKLDTILKKNISKGMIKELALEINRDFKDLHFVVYCKEKKYIDDRKMAVFLERIRKDTVLGEESAIVKYKKGILIIKTVGAEERKKLEAAQRNVLADTMLDNRSYWVGFGRIYSDLEDLDSSVNEALYAATACELENHEIEHFGDIGTYGVLLPNQDSFWMKSFHERVTGPIKGYDKKYGAQMFETLSAYVTSGGDIQLAAEILFVHSNTVRYRIGKIKEIIGMERREGLFHEEVFLAMKLEKIYRLKGN